MGSELLSKIGSELTTRAQ